MTKHLTLLGHRMTRIFPILLFIGLAWGQAKMDINNLIDRGGLLYKPNDDKPYTGRVFDLWSDGDKKLEGRCRKGLKNGKWTQWRPNRKKEIEFNYKDGEADGKWINYDYNGHKKQERTFKVGKQNGLWASWYKNGQKKYEKTYKDNELISAECWDKVGNECECEKYWDGGCK